MTRNTDTKKSVLIGWLFLLLLSIGTTAAYFTHWQDINNRVTVGEIIIEIEENYKPPKELMVGDNVFKKQIQIRNTAGVPCFVRVSAEFSDSTVKELAHVSPDGTVWFSASDYASHLPEGWEYIDKTDDPLLGGYFYWTGILEKAEKTAPLFEKVKVVFKTQDQIRDFDLLVQGECVQIADTDGADFSGRDAWKQAWNEFLERR